MLPRILINLFSTHKEYSNIILLIGSILFLFFMAPLAQKAGGVGSELKSLMAEDEMNVENKAKTKYEEDDNSEPFGYLSFTVYPGYKRIRLDRENTIGFSENILVPVGNHWVEIISPQGYADTSFKVEVLNGQLNHIVIQLRDKMTGKLAPKSQQKFVSSGTSPFWISVQVGCIAGSIALGYLAYREDIQAQESIDNYENLTASAGANDFGQHYDEADQHVKLRNGMIGLSVLSLIAGVVVWIVK